MRPGPRVTSPSPTWPAWAAPGWSLPMRSRRAIGNASAASPARPLRCADQVPFVLSVADRSRWTCPFDFALRASLRATSDTRPHHPAQPPHQDGGDQGDEHQVQVVQRRPREGEHRIQRHAEHQRDADRGRVRPAHEDGDDERRQHRHRVQPVQLLQGADDALGIRIHRHHRQRDQHEHKLHPLADALAVRLRVNIGKCRSWCRRRRGVQAACSDSTAPVSRRERAGPTVATRLRQPP